MYFKGQPHLCKGLGAVGAKLRPSHLLHHGLLTLRSVHPEIRVIRPVQICINVFCVKNATGTIYLNHICATCRRQKGTTSHSEHTVFEHTSYDSA